MRHTRTELKAGLAGALVAELALDGLLDLSGNRLTRVGLSVLSTLRGGRPVSVS